MADIEADLAGRDQLSAIERALIEAFAGAAVTLHHLNTKLALGEQIDISQHAPASARWCASPAGSGCNAGALCQTLGIFVILIGTRLARQKQAHGMPPS